ncbi:Uncharacterised protein [Providencia alcalifaciens]|nr:Uncharacterised protein [Providencia alcalifaciens]
MFCVASNRNILWIIVALASIFCAILLSGLGGRLVGVQQV